MPADFEVVEANNNNNNNMSSPQSPNFTNHKFQDSCLIFNGESLEKYLEIFSQSFFTGGCFSPTGTWSLVVGKILKIFEYTYVENTLEIFENVFENIKIYFDFLIFFQYLIIFVLLFDGRMLLSDWHLVSGCGQIFENFRIYVENILEIFENVFENMISYSFLDI